jgi:cell division protein FtsB
MKAEIFKTSEKENSSLKSIIASRKFILIAFILLIVIIYSFFQASARVKRMKNKLNNLERQVQSLDREVEALDKKLQEVGSKNFVEEMARKNLGLVKPGEILYITIDEDKSNKDKRAEK